MGAECQVRGCDNVSRTVEHGFHSCRRESHLKRSIRAQSVWSGHERERARAARENVANSRWNGDVFLGAGTESGYFTLV